MIIDDNEQLQNELGNLLVNNGYSIIKPQTFDNIPSFVKENLPHLILLDINLPTITLGGDDFIVKPYNTQILLARIHSLLKRAYPNEKTSDTIEHNKLQLHILSSTIEYNGNIMELTKNELKILHYLMTHKGKILSRMDIMEYLWDNSMFINDNTLTVNIGRLRSKIEQLGLTDYIKTKRGQGYFV